MWLQFCLSVKFKRSVCVSRGVAVCRVSKQVIEFNETCSGFKGHTRSISSLRKEKGRRLATALAATATPHSATPPIPPPPGLVAASQMNVAQTGRIVRAKRMVVAANPTEFEYLEGSIPSEWDAWIRGRRKQPPSIEELVKNQNYREHIKIKAREVEEKEQALQAKEYEEGLVAGPAQTIAKGHAAATSFGQPVTSEEPVSTANTFQPGSWSPTAKK
uniref:NADH dehydrogenase [ubiquinone] 1 alpha subcomplex assembly factor 2 n=1 Tax=Esox lucius TaxID=8010 RepID=A0AAY5K9U5_ESOLU